MSSTMVRSALLSLSLLLSFHAHAKQFNEQTNLWSSFRYTWKLENQEVSTRLQSRYNFSTDELYKERLNLSYKKNIYTGTLGAIITFGTLDFFNKLEEIRYAFQWESSHQIKPSLKYKIRFRQEARDFHYENSLVFRFRIRNQVDFAPNLNKNWSLSLSSEPNYYLNSFTENNSGFASHRTIFSYNQMDNWGDWRLSLIHDYKDSLLEIESLYILSFSCELKK